MFLSEIDQTQLSALSVSATSYSLVQLSGGGNAVLSAPSAPLLSGKLLKLIVTGRVQISSGGGNPQLSIYLGTSTGSPVVASTGGMAIGTSSGSGALINNFAIEYDFSWDSTAGQTIPPGVNTYPPGTVVSPVSSQSNIEFVIGSAKGSGGDSNFTLTITEFKLELI